MKALAKELRIIARTLIIRSQKLNEAEEFVLQMVSEGIANTVMDIDNEKSNEPNYPDVTLTEIKKAIKSLLKKKLILKQGSRLIDNVDGSVDDVAKDELSMYMENEQALYNQLKSIVKNIQRKMKAGKYDHKKAPKLWMYWVDNGAKMYVKEFGGTVKEQFPKSLRMELAQDLADQYKEEIEAQDMEMF